MSKKVIKHSHVTAETRTEIVTGEWVGLEDQVISVFRGSVITSVAKQPVVSQGPPRIKAPVSFDQWKLRWM